MQNEEHTLNRDIGHQNHLEDNGSGSYKASSQSRPKSAQTHLDSANTTTHHNKVKDYGVKFVAYGGKAAFQVSETRNKDGKKTINVESANKFNPNDLNDKKLDWQNKVTFQLTVNELPVFIAVMFGFIPHARFDLHGVCNSKFLDLISQGDKFVFKSGAQGVQMKVAPVSIPDATHFGMLALSSYSNNFPNLTSDSVLGGLKVLVRRLVDAKQIKIPQQR